jgi:RND family efflux transporter MFP subunit
MAVSVFRAVPSSTYEKPQRFLGRVEARRRSSLGFEIPGILETVTVEEGDRLKKGQVLGTLNTDRLKARLEENRAAQDQLTAEEALAELTLSRQTQLNQSAAVSQQTVDEARTKLRAVQAELRRLRAQERTLRVDLESSRLRAPFDSRVMRRLLDEGSVLSPGTPILELLEDKSLEARIFVSREAAGRWELGHTAILLWRDQPLTATLRAVLGATNRQTRTVDLIFQLGDDPAVPVQDGDLVSLESVQERKDEGYWFPLASLGEGRRGLWSCLVAVPKEGVSISGPGNLPHILERRDLEVLFHDESRAFVRGAIRPGDLVIQSGIQRLVPGLEITPVIAGSQN